MPSAVSHGGNQEGGTRVDLSAKVVDIHPAQRRREGTVGTTLSARARQPGARHRPQRIAKPKPASAKPIPCQSLAQDRQGASAAPDRTSGRLSHRAVRAQLSTTIGREVEKAANPPTTVHTEWMRGNTSRIAQRGRPSTFKK